jgi:phosphoribosyl 1,2-cyclic phosphodiesterase
VKGIRFWGTRGSLPATLTAEAVRQKIVAALAGASGRAFATRRDLNAYVDGLDFAVSGTYGGHTACVELVTPGSEYVLCDLGTGVRPFGQAALARHGATSPQTYHVFVSHMHWDHIMGFPFFGPAYLPGAKIRIHSCHDACEHAFRLQQAAPCFPVDFDYLSAAIEFVKLVPDQPHEISGVTVTPHLQLHAGDSYGFRFEKDGKSVVYTTDSEHKLENFAESAEFVDFLRDADVVIFDAMYSMLEAISVKADWGHSSNVVGVELCQMAGARHLVLFHHEPANDDATLLRLLKEARRLEELTRGERSLEITSAFDGMEIEL